MTTFSSLVNKSFILFIALFIMTMSCDNDSTEQPQEEEVDLPPVILGEWELAFEDDFDGDLSQWDLWTGGAFNEEIQLYRPEQLSIDNSILSINVQREQATGPTNPFDSTPRDYEFVSGRLESSESFGPTLINGSREVRIMASLKLPLGNGMWPAFWTFGDPWPTQGEIDILEARGSTPVEFQSNLFYGPTANNNINFNNAIIYDIGEDLTSEFHTYEMIWTADLIQILFDGEILHTYTANTQNNIANMLNKKQKIVLNTAVGGVFFTDRNPSNYTDSAVMEVDWVRAYTR